MKSFATIAAIKTVSHTPFPRLVTLCIALLTWQTAHSMDLNTKLLGAARRGNTARVTALLYRGADFNAKDLCGLTPLHEAARGGHTAIVTLLLDRGADFNAKDLCGLTPLHEAALRGAADMVRLLLDRGADVNAKDNDGWTPLHSAAQSGNAVRVTALLEGGANPYMLDSNGQVAGDKGFVGGMPKRGQLMQSYEDQLHKNARQDIAAAMVMERVRREKGLMPSYPMELVAQCLVGPAQARHILLQPGDAVACRAQHKLINEEGIERDSLALMAERGYQLISQAQWAYLYPQLHALIGEQTGKRCAIEREEKRERANLMSALAQTAPVHP